MNYWKYSSNYLDGNDVEAVFAFIQRRYPGKFVYRIHISPPINDFVIIVRFMVLLSPLCEDKEHILKFTSEEFRSRDALLTYCFPYIDALLESWEYGEALPVKSG